jgi:adenosylmethionine---8-amino-7-oxononanoate aminotransferase
MSYYYTQFTARYSLPTTYDERPMTSNEAFARRDLGLIWHPCTQMKDHEHVPLIPIRRARGVWLEDFDGRRYLDAISSWWVNLFGHSNPRINAAISAQLERFEHVLLAGFTHEPAVSLCERLKSVVPAGLSRCFFADNGSSAVEAALKMSFHYWRNVGSIGKQRFVCLSNSYHGETIGALSVGDVALYKEIYRPLLWDVITVPSPDCYEREPGESCEDVARRQFAKMDEVLSRNCEQICAVIVEPLVQCAGGMRMHHPGYLSLLREACDRYQVHLIADEIAVGFGRTGTMFACEQAGVSPDLMCLSKGLTGGYMPLSVVMARDEIYQAFYDDYENHRAFLHSHSYAGNPLACSAAVATLDIFSEQGTIENNLGLARVMADCAATLSDHAHIAEIRQTGMILAFEMVKSKTDKLPYPWQERRGLKAYRYGLEHEAVLRPLGDVLYLMPPYVISEEEIRGLVTTVRGAIDNATAEA